MLEQFEMDDWMEALEDWPVYEVRDALRAWVINNPSRRPNYGDIRAILNKRRGQQWAGQKPQLKEPVRKPVSADRAAEIMAANGYSPRRFPR